MKPSSAYAYKSKEQADERFITADNQIVPMEKIRISYLIILCCCLTACGKIEYTKMDSPAYLRVFNNFTYNLTVENKNEQFPIFTMLIEPRFDGSGTVTGAEVIGDFLDKRDYYAPPYPSHIGNSTSVFNPEYPGKENVLVGPVLNGFDLSSWAQVPSGKRRIMFVYRPKSEVPFLQLPKHLRSKVLVDTVLNLEKGEVFTLHLLQKDFNTRENGMILRQEQFHKMPLSDSLVYVNIYNMSSKGFWNANAGFKDKYEQMGMLNFGIKDVMNVYYSLVNYDHGQAQWFDRAVNGHNKAFMGTIQRDTESGKVHPYFSFPVFADAASDNISTKIWQRFFFLPPGNSLENYLHYELYNDNEGNFAIVNCFGNGLVRPFADWGGAAMLPNLLVNVHSGVHNPRTFGTVNTLEIVNGKVFLTTVQRKYAPPVY